MDFSFTILILTALISSDCYGKIQIDFHHETRVMKKLPRFWCNVGFAPPEPVENVTDFFNSEDVHHNLEIIGSLPNNGIENVRIHWLLNLLSVK